MRYKIERHFSDKYVILNNSLRKMILKNAKRLIANKGRCSTSAYNIDCGYCPNKLVAWSGIQKEDCSFKGSIALAEKVLAANKKKK